MKTVRRDDVERMLELSGLSVELEAFPSLQREISEILDYVSVLGADEADTEVQNHGQSPLGTNARLRADIPTGASSIKDAGRFAPQFEDEFFVVPRPPSMGDG